MVKDFSQANFGCLEIKLAEVEMPDLMACQTEFGGDPPGVLVVRQGHPRLGPDGGPDLIVDDDGDATLLIHEGIKAKELYEKTDELPDPNSTDNVEFQIVLTIIRDRLKTDPTRNHKMKERFVGVYEETTTGVKRLYQMQANETLLFPVINVKKIMFMMYDPMKHGHAAEVPHPASEAHRTHKRVRLRCNAVSVASVVTGHSWMQENVRLDTAYQVDTRD
ncbi:hypothetical protein JHK82_015775 [Glycine max]|nr:hypothetical protein JHK85_016171 [Glycine max]KAG5148894.1 hypothetical protein JHK82_015775 [Glycine max]